MVIVIIFVFVNRFDCSVMLYECDIQRDNDILLHHTRSIKIIPMKMCNKNQILNEHEETKAKIRAKQKKMWNKR